MKITLNHYDFYIQKKVQLSSPIWGWRVHSTSISIHDLINCQSKVQRLSIANKNKNLFMRRLNRQNTLNAKILLVDKYLRNYTTDDEYVHLVPFLSKIKTRLMSI